MPNFWFKFEWGDWRNDRQLRRCSKETRGFWIDCIAAMEEQSTFFLEGTPEEICREVVADRGEFDRSLAELSRHGAATIEKRQETVKIISRRLLRKISITEYNRLKKRESRAGHVSNKSQEIPSLKDLELKNLRTLEEEKEDTDPAGEKPQPKIMLPADYKPPSEFWDWARTNCRNLNLLEELQEFITFWRDIATKNNRRTIRGWNATWKTRMKDRQEAVGEKQNGISKQNGKPTSEREKSAERNINTRNFADELERDALARIAAVSGQNDQAGAEVDQPVEQPGSH